MPKGFFRFLAVLLLALAVPAQGLATVAAAQCMVFGHHHDGAGDKQDTRAHDGADGHDHAAHSHADKGGAKHGDEGSKTARCGPCTACCASAAIAGPVGISIPASSSNTKYVVAQFPPPAAQPRRLDRPPLAP